MAFLYILVHSLQRHIPTIYILLQKPRIPVTGHLNGWDVNKALERDWFYFMSCGQDLHSDLEEAPSPNSGST